jgi:hypothetical protein
MVVQWQVSEVGRQSSAVPNHYGNEDNREVVLVFGGGSTTVAVLQLGSLAFFSFLLGPSLIHGE